MLKKFNCGMRGAPAPRLPRPGLWLRLCFCLGRRLWQLFALAGLLLFAYVLWHPCAYLLVVCFIIVLGLMVWLQKGQ